MNIEIHVTARYQLWSFVVETGRVDSWGYALTSIALVNITFDTLDNEASFQRTSKRHHEMPCDVLASL